MDRYRVELSLNIYCDSDKEAIKIAENICNEQNKRFDNRCQVINLYESPFARFKERLIKFI